MAFNTTKHGAKTNDIYLKDYLEKHQFRHFLQFIRQYYEYWVAFDSIDLDGDRQLSLVEFKLAKEVLERWGIDMSDPEAHWKELDSDHSNSVSFDEFCSWAFKKNLERESNVDDDDIVFTK